MTGRAAQIAEAVQMVVLDVDGVLTDGTLLYGEDQDGEIKAFNIKDGLGIKLLQHAGIPVAIITGRISQAVQRRAAELGIEMSVQGREDKGAALCELLDSVNVNPSAVAYMGDDLPDISALKMVGLATCPSDAAKAVLDIADWVSPCAGGCGAVRALSEFILESQGKLLEAVERYQ